MWLNFIVTLYSKVEVNDILMQTVIENGLNTSLMKINTSGSDARLNWYRQCLYAHQQYYKFLIICECIIQQFNRFESKCDNIKSGILNIYYLVYICLKNKS